MVISWLEIERSSGLWWVSTVRLELGELHNINRTSTGVSMDFIFWCVCVWGKPHTQSLSVGCLFHELFYAGMETWRCWHWVGVTTERYRDLHQSHFHGLPVRIRLSLVSWFIVAVPSGLSLFCEAQECSISSVKQKRWWAWFLVA